MHRLYEGVAQGLFLDPFNRDVFYLLMQSENTTSPWWFTTDLENLIHEVAATGGLYLANHPGTEDVLHRMD